MKIKLLLDEDIHLPVALALRKRGHDVIHVQELDRKGRSDSSQLKYSVKMERCLYSFNVKHFVLLHNEYVKNEQDHYGIIVSKQYSIGETIRKLLKIMQLYTNESIKNRIEFL